MVVVIIAILAAIAVPSLALRIRERRSQQTALQIAGIYRGSAHEALGRGASILVSYKDSRWTVREGVEGAAASTLRTGDDKCQNLPTRGCTTNDWGNATSRSVGAFDPAGTASDITADVAFQGSAADDVDICFSPLGRAFVRQDSGTWSPLTSVLVVDGQRQEADNQKVGLKRQVVVLPNGTARLALMSLFRRARSRSRGYTAVELMLSLAIFARRGDGHHRDAEGDGRLEPAREEPRPSPPASRRPGSISSRPIRRCGRST